MRYSAFAILLAAPAFAAQPTFYKDVLPVLQQRCQECHRPGEVAPFALQTYEQARPWAKAMKEAILSRKMPPWSADPHFGKFTNDRSLTATEIRTISDWADSGAKAGDPKAAPKPLAFTQGWTIGKPDEVFDTGYDFDVPAQGKIGYTYFVVATNFAEDKWVKDLEVRPGNVAVVHHIVLYARPKGSKFAGNAKPGSAPFTEPDDPEEATRPHPAENDRGMLYGINGGSYEMVGVYVPGGIAYKTLDGQARLIPSGSDLIFQIHYTANGKPGKDRSKVGMTFAKEAPKERVINTFIMNTSLKIPAGDANHQVEAKVTLQHDAKLQSLFPHMHVRGKSFAYTATYPTGETSTLLNVPHYDFNWQLTYALEKPILLPKGTVLKATAIYDNSANNPFNPDPKKEVYWGEQTWEEMLAGFVDLVIPANVNPVELVRPLKPVAPSGAGQ